jgi:hypothetical protein
MAVRNRPKGPRLPEKEQSPTTIHGMAPNLWFSVHLNPLSGSHQPGMASETHGNPQCSGFTWPFRKATPYPIVNPTPRKRRTPWPDRSSRIPRSQVLRRDHPLALQVLPGRVPPGDPKLLHISSQWHGRRRCGEPPRCQPALLGPRSRSLPMGPCPLRN